MAGEGWIPALVALAAALAASLLLLEGSRYPFELPSGAAVEGHVRVVPYDGSPLAEVAERHTDAPVVVRGGKPLPSASWRASSAWASDRGLLAAMGGERARVGPVFHSASRGRVFGPIWRPDRAMAAVPTVRWRNPHAEERVEAGDFVRRARRGESVYYTGLLEALGGRAARDAAPLGPLLLTPERSQVNVWLGAPGVVTHGHYDSYTNLYVQVRGRKRFLLFPPDEWPRMPIFPSTHPSVAQLQDDVFAEEEKDGAGAGTGAGAGALAGARGLEAVLGPGDMLVMPPLWFHAVEALDGGDGISASVNAWSVSNQSDVMEGAMAELAALDAAVGQLGDDACRAAAARVLRGLGNLVARPAGSPPRPGGRCSAVPLVDALLASRYDGLFERGELEASLAGGCGGDVAGDRSAVVAAAADRAVARARAVLERLPAAWAFNFADSLALWATNDAASAGAWLNSCCGFV